MPRFMFGAPQMSWAAANAGTELYGAVGIWLHDLAAVVRHASEATIFELFELDVYAEM